jgi:hypothetical protein
MESGLDRIALHGHGLAPGGLDLGNQFFRSRFASRIIDRHRRAATGQFRRDTRADALGCARHQRYFALKVRHVSSPFPKCLRFDISITIEFIREPGKWIQDGGEYLFGRVAGETRAAGFYLGPPIDLCDQRK